jgi:hypothetical protein
MTTTSKPQWSVRRLLGEILSQILNVPVMTGLLILYLYLRMPASLPNRLPAFLIALLFLSIIPLCSLFFYIPGKAQTREAVAHRQRVASFVFMAVSYPAGALALYLIGSPRIFTATAMSYTLITLGLIVFNLLIHYKASGHAAGVAGPVASLIYLYGWMASPLLALLPLVTWARVMAKGHNTWQMVVGAALSLTIAVAVLYVFGFSPFSGHLY